MNTSISSDSISYDPNQNSSQSQGGILSRVTGTAYNTTATVLGTTKNIAVPVIGNAAWLTGAALSTSFGVVKNVGSYVLPTRLKPAESKDKSD